MSGTKLYAQEDPRKFRLRKTSACALDCCVQWATINVAGCGISGVGCGISGLGWDVISGAGGISVRLSS